MKWDQTVQKLAYKSKGYLQRNAPTILTCVGAVGVIATAVTAVRATPKALSLLEAQEAEKEAELTTVEKLQIAGPHYIPAALIGIGSIACIFGANTLNKRQQATIVSAYTLLDTSFKEYKRKVEELYGEDANANVRSGIAKDKYKDVDVEFEDDEKLFYDYFSERYFTAKPEDVIGAQYKLNRQLYTNGGAYLNEWYEFLNNKAVEPIPAGQELGWSTGILESHYWANWIEFEHDEVVMEDGIECTIISFRYEPVIDFAYY